VSIISLKLASEASIFSIISFARISGSGRLSRSAKALVFEPEDIQVRFIPCYNFIISEFTEPAFGRFFTPGLFTIVAIFGVIAFYEVFQIRIFHRVLKHELPLCTLALKYTTSA